MKVKSLLKKAANCNNQAGADDLLKMMVKLFSESSPLSHLLLSNEEAYMEGDQPFVRFELNHVISDHYITMIRPQIRDGELTIYVVTNRMLDGLGMSSQSWDSESDMEYDIEAEEDQTIAHLTRQAKQLAIDNHSQLIQRLGISPEDALKVVKKNW